MKIKYLLTTVQKLKRAIKLLNQVLFEYIGNEKVDEVVVLGLHEAISVPTGTLA